jgi:hypothetical protein
MAIVFVPKTAMYKDDCVVLGEYEVWRTWQLAIMESETKAERKQA